eukprot:Colp12_sorted_trinity150504_noHs@31575
MLTRLACALRPVPSVSIRTTSKALIANIKPAIFRQHGFKLQTASVKPPVAQGLIMKRFSSTVAANVTHETASSAEASVAGSKSVGVWLFGIAGMVFGAVSLGGVTRLTESGLSIVTWDVIKGMKPPTSQADWEAEFEKYKAFPEYQILNRNMTVDEFKNIFWLEWGHRMWGRAIGLAFIFPGLYFWKKGYITKALKKPALAIGALIGFQGALGWFMVKSGLEQKENPREVPRVSQYRLAAHLGTAFVIYATSLWTSFSLLIPPVKIEATNGLKRFARMSKGLSHLVFFTALSGAFVAGLDAGLVYNSFPKMADRWIPEDLFVLSPVLRNLTENPTTVQFDHRILGTTTGLAIGALWAASRTLPLPPRARTAVNCLAGMAVVQVSLGIATLLYFVPVSLAASHQAGSLTLLSFALWLAHELKRVPK